MIKVKPDLARASRLFREGQIVCAELEHNGIRLDMPYLKGLIKKTGEEIREMEEQLKADPAFKTWRKVYGGDRANLNSRAQLARVIFDELGYERAAGKKSKQRSDESGDSHKKESTADEAAFANVDLPFIKLYFRMQKRIKMKSTYLDGMIREQVDGVLRPFFGLHRAVTYRSSSDTPNFQNIPKRNKEIAHMVRQCYIPRPGNRLVEIDYAGIEVRIAACYHNDPTMIKYLTEKNPDGSDKNDMHRDMAAFVFMMDTEFLVEHKGWAKPCVRDWAKNRLVFPMFYGSIACQCAPDLWRGVLQHKAQGGFMPDGKTTIRRHLRSKGIRKLGPCEFDDDPPKGTFACRVKEAENYLWNTMFPVYTEWKKKWYEQYLRRGWFAMHTGFVVDALLKKNDVLNYSIQGSASHCKLQAMIWIVQELRRRKMKTKIVGEIHDCILADVPPDELQDYLTLAREVMAVRLPREWRWIIVPLEVECEVGEVDGSWNTVQVWNQVNGVWQPPPPKK